MKFETIKDLNKKWWYRLVKVIYLLFIVILFLGVSSLSIKEKKVVDNKKSHIQCDNGAIIYRNNLVDSGLLDSERLNLVGKDLKKTFSSLCREKGDSLIGEYKLKIIYIWKTQWGKTILNIFLIAIAFIISNEIIRRIFYYVVFGKIKPNKK